MKIQSISRIPVLYHVKREGWAEESETGSKKYYMWPSEVPAVIVKVLTADGQLGIGEAGIMHWYLGNTQANVYKVLGLYQEALRGQDPTNLEKVHQTLFRVFGRGAPGSRDADYALDMALYDILGRAWGEPVYNLLGGAHQLEIPINPNLYLGTAEQMVEQSKRLVRQGYKAIKVKCGMDIEEAGWSLDVARADVRKLTRTVEELPDNILIDADANQSWGNYKRAISIVKAFGLERYLNLGIEQPGHYLDIEGASKIARAIKLQLVLDESIFSPEALANVIMKSAADRIVLQPCRVGGLFVARKMISTAESFGVNVAIDPGSACSYLACTAEAHLAATIKEPYPGSFYVPEDILEDPVKNHGYVIEDGYAKLRSTPGLGIELNDDVIEEIRVDVDLPHAEYPRQA